MAFIGAKTPRLAQTVDLTTFELQEADATWLQERLGTQTPKTTEIDALIDGLEKAASDPETTARLRLARAIKDAIIGGQKTLPGAVTVSKDGAAARDGVGQAWQALAKTAVGEPAQVTRVRDGIGAALWGHESEVESFCRWAKDHVSTARLTPAVLALSGDPGHGKDGALVAFAKLIGKATTDIRSVDFSRVKDSDLPLLFGEEGPLSIKDLKSKAVTPGLVVRLSGLDNLEQRAPAIAQALNQRLLARRGEALFAAIPYVLDFDHTSASPRALVNAALGQAGNRVISAESTFAHLDGPTMARYATELFIPRLLSARGLSDITVNWEPDALSLLGEMLATPLAPLDEIEHRLLRFVLTHIDTQEFERKDAVVSGRISPAFAGNEGEPARIEMTAKMQAAGADLVAAEKVFWMPVVGKRIDPAKRVAALEQARQLGSVVDAATMQLMAALPDPDPNLETLVEALLSSLGAHRSLIEQTMRTVARRERFNPLNLVRENELGALDASANAVEAALAEYTASANEVMTMLPDPSALVAPDAVATDVRTAMQSISSALYELAGKASSPKSAPNEVNLIGTSESLKGHARFCTKVVMSPDGSVVASADGAGQVILWDTKTGAAIGAPIKGGIGDASIYALAFSPDGKSLAISGNDKSVHLLDVASRTESVAPVLPAAVKTVAFSPDGQQVLAGDDAGNVHVWDTSNLTQIVRMISLFNASCSINALSFSRDGSKLFIGSSAGIRSIDSSFTSPEIVSGAGAISSIALSPSDDRLAVAQGSSIVMLDATTHAPIGEPLNGHTKNVTSVVFSSSGRHVISGSEDGTMRVWDLEQMTSVELPRDHTSQVRSVALSSDGKTLASASNDQSVRLWRLPGARGS
jgi:WD domain, G-beta repeat